MSIYLDYDDQFERGREFCLVMVHFVVRLKIVHVRCATVREEGVSRYHGAPINAPPETPNIAAMFGVSIGPS